MNSVITVLVSSTFIVLCCSLPQNSYMDDDVLLERVIKLSRVKRIAGGNVTHVGEWPWLAKALGKVPSRMFWGLPLSYNYHHCGATLVSSRHVVTAAHCFDDDRYPDRIRTPKYWHFTLGEIIGHMHAYDSFVSWMGEVFGREDWIIHRYHAKKITIHPRYNPRSMWENDIAVVELEDEVPLENGNIAALALPKPGTVNATWPENGQMCVMKGWGCTADGQPVQDKAMAVALPKVPDSQCKATYGRADLTDTRLCAGYNMQGKGICSGDSGGPLACQYNGNWYLAGVASFSAFGAPAEYPGAFTKVTFYTEWITSIINKKN